MRKKPNDTEVFGSDSFLDVVCNVVGMLIILVVIVGIRAGQAGRIVKPDQAATDQALAPLQAENAAAEAEVLRLADEMQHVALQSQALARERDAVAVLVAAGERLLEDERKKLDARTQDDYAKRRLVSEAGQQLTWLERQLSAPLEQAPAIKLTSYQTPISKSVHGKELQFQIRGGRVTMIPIEELLERFKSDAQAKAHRLRNQPELTDVIGPIGGFRMQYVLERVDASIEDQMRTGKAMSVVQLAEYNLLPESTQLGETLEEALTSRSLFYADLTPYKPSETTVTLWTYEDSFREYRALKEALHKLGYAVAGRPMPHGQTIGGSPHGSRSAAQ